MYIHIYIATGLADHSGSITAKRYKYTALSVLDPCLFLKTGLPRPFLKRRREKAWLKIHQTLQIYGFERFRPRPVPRPVHASRLPEVGGQESRNVINIMVW